MEYNNSNQITMVSVERIDKGLKISYRPMLETLYYCPGIKINETPQNIEISFVRCDIKNTCPVTLKANHAAEQGIDYITIENNNKPVFAKFKDSTLRLSAEN
ncbi:hypothetical protein MNBD_GAMMA10-2874 [hydrothermal vent metagenome]|uniref:Uncharacterized protein n=1 Tax=hydrothermal vent metagenome TaxID=652676 RepID=A0A3B0XXG3_9ZZZZ